MRLDVAAVKIRHALSKQLSAVTLRSSVRYAAVRIHMVVFAGEGTGGGHVLVTEYRSMALNGLFCASVLRPLDLAPLTDFTYKIPSCVTILHTAY